MKLLGWPMKSPSATSELKSPMASICPGDVGRITATFGNVELINSHGTGKIRLVCSRRECIGYSREMGKRLRYVLHPAQAGDRNASQLTRFSPDQSFARTFSRSQFTNAF